MLVRVSLILWKINCPQTLKENYCSAPLPSHFKFFKGYPPQILLDLIYDKIFHNSQNLSKMLENLNIAKL